MAKYTNRLAPCPIWEMEAMEGWMEHLAAEEGLFLDKDPFWGGFVRLRKGEPKAVRYRLVPMPLKKGLFPSADPDPAFIEMAEEQGWTYLRYEQQFCIFTTDDPNVPELNTDPQVEALSMNRMIRKEIRRFSIGLAAKTFLLAFLIYLGPLYFLLYFPWWLCVIIPVTCIADLVFGIQNLKYLRSLQQKLQEGTPRAHTGDWKNKQWPHWIISAVFIILLVPTLLGLYLHLIQPWPGNASQTPVPDLATPTARDIGEFTPTAYRGSKSDHSAARSNLLAKEQIHLTQRGTLEADGKRGQVSLRVDYCDLRWEWAAKSLFTSIQRIDALNIWLDPLPCPDLPTDQEVCYGRIVWPIYLLRQGTKVIRIDMIGDEDDDHPPSFWLELYVDYLTQ